MPDPQKLCQTIRKAIAQSRGLPGRQGRVLSLRDLEDCLVGGDLHGQLSNFKRLMDCADLARHPRRHLVVQECVHGPYRYPNGSDQSHRLVDLVAALQCQYPGRVHYLLGNHELAQWTGRAVGKGDEELNDLFCRGVETAYGHHAPDLLDAYNDYFAALPVAIRLPNRVFLSHSLPSRGRLKDWELSHLYRENASPEDLSFGGCIYSVVWGRDVSAANVADYLTKVDADWLISGHIPCDEGYALPNERQLIIDCKDAAAHACLVPTTTPLDQPALLRGLLRLQPLA